MVALIVISVALLVWGFIAGFDKNEGQPVDVLLYWAYVMIAIAVISVVLIGVVISVKNNPKSLVKLGIGLVAVVALCAIAYVLAAGKPAVGLTTMEMPSASTLKLTDAILILTAITGVGAIAAIVIGEIRLAIANKK